MIVYKTIDQYDKNTGKKIESIRVLDYHICDFTGEKIDKYDNPNIYHIDYNGNDPCFGDGIGEKWLYETGEKYRYFYHELFSTGNYIFSTKNNEGEPVLEIIETFKKEVKEDIYDFDQLFRWCRGRMLKRVIEEGKYKIEDFIEEIID